LFGRGQVMAKGLTFTLGGAKACFELGSKIDKKALYGFARRIAEKDGRALARGLLLGDGRLLPSQAAGWIRVDPEGSPVDEVQTRIDGVVAELKPSSFDVESPLESEPLARLAEFSVSDVYPLQFSDGTAPAAGLYRTEFAYRKSHQPKDALLLVRESECYLLIGVAKSGAFLDLSIAYDFFDAEAEADEADDELDFSMV
jgi:hypothetical protein